MRIILGGNCPVQDNFPWQVLISATVTGDFFIVFVVKHFIIAVFLFVRNRGDKIVRTGKHYICSDTDETTVAFTKRVYRTPVFVLVKHFQEVECWGTLEQGKEEEKGCQGYKFSS
jgi:hypothetical protein